MKLAINSDEPNLADGGFGRIGSCTLGGVDWQPRAAASAPPYHTSDSESSSVRASTKRPLARYPLAELRTPFARSFAIAVFLAALTGCTKLQNERDVEGVFSPSACVHMLGRQAGALRTPTTVTVCQPIRVSAVGTMTYNTLDPTNSTAEVALLEFTGGGVYVQTDKLRAYGTFDFHDTWRIHTVHVVLFLVALGIPVGVWINVENKKQQAQARRRADEAERKAKRQAEEAAREAEKEAARTRHASEQEAYRQQMVGLGEESLGLFETIPEHLRNAEQHLDQAEIDFAEGTFAPFWDSVERAANTLGRFDEGIRHINDNSSRYTGLIRQYEREPPMFPLSPQTVAKLSVGTVTAERMKSIVRRAQRNFQFAMIYEQRKTNQLLVAGFTSLGQALDQMTWRITSSITDLAGSVDSMGSMLNDSVRAVDYHLVEMEAATVRHREMLSLQDVERAGREEKAVEMLDNIQRRRKPYP